MNETSIGGLRSLSPVQNRRGRWYKREDLYRDPMTGVNGAKWRQCQWLAKRASANSDILVTGASILSPQHAMVAVAAKMFGMHPIHIIGGTSVEKASRTPSVSLAMRQGAEFRAIRVGYNPALQSEVRSVARDLGAEILHYGITTGPEADHDEIRAFHDLGAGQVANLPPDLDDVIVPFGSGNSGTSVLYGMAQSKNPPKRIHLIGIGPDRRDFLRERLEICGVRDLPFEVKHHDLHGTGVVSYGQKVKWTEDGILFHPTYEAKILRWLHQNPNEVPGWTKRDNSAMLWIVGGPLPEAA